MKTAFFIQKVYNFTNHIDVVTDPTMKKQFCISTKELIGSIEENTNKSEDDFKVGRIVVITFSKFLIDYIKTRINLEEKEWFTPYHPYASNPVFQGLYEKKRISIIIPPMGASPIATVGEDLIYCGAKLILLACGCWGIKNDISLYDFIIPSYAVGRDGTSIYYDRKPGQKIKIDEEIVDMVINETKKLTNSFYVGKNFSFEAFYRMKKENILKLQNSGYISLENGELNVLATLCKLNGIKFGALFYNYYNPLIGWKIPWLYDTYKKCINLQGEIILNIINEYEFD